jgi:PAS domain S-box-containing protein
MPEPVHLAVAAVVAVSLVAALVAAVGAAAAWMLAARERRHARRLATELQRYAALERALAMRQDVLENAVEGIAQLDRNGNITEVNRALAQLMERPGETMAGRPFGQLLHPDSRDAWRDALAALPRVGRVKLAAQTIALEGQAKPLDLVVVASRAPGVAYVLVQDASERRQVQESEQLAFMRRLENEQLSETNRFKTMFLNAAAHEIHTPMTPLLLQMHMLANGSYGPLNEQQVRAIGVLKRNLNRLEVLVRDMLDAARLQSGKMRLEPSRFDLVPVLHDTAATYDELARSNGVQVTVQAPKTFYVQGDPNRIGQILVNLVSNAVKFTPAGGRVQLSARGGDRVKVEVTDSGIGLTAEQVARVFQPFERIEGEARKNVPGTGLGLYLARGLAMAHGGELTCSSRGPGQGTTFTLALPTVRAERPPRPGRDDERPRKTGPSIDIAAGQRGP